MNTTGGFLPTLAYFALLSVVRGCGLSTISYGTNQRLSQEKFGGTAVFWRDFPLNLGVFYLGVF